MNQSFAGTVRGKQPVLAGEQTRTPAVIRSEGNHLKGQRSLYLQQHAHNPVDWYPWGPEALERAALEDKPIFLSIGYSSCHWCHVMEHEVFEHDSVAALLNAHFISIKVDREERPDLDKVYMEAVIAMTGSGGWPMSVFLTPDQRPFFGATYIPRPRFEALLGQIRTTFESDREQLDALGARLFSHVNQDPTPQGENRLDPSVFSEADQTAKKLFDPEWGGFMAQMKFPMPVRWQFLLHRYRKTGDPELRRMLVKTLDEMASGGIRDHLAGGFHRYTVERTWLVPHFEKMLYDNALLISLYAEAAAVLDEPAYARVADDSLEFMIGYMRADEGAFFASFDADSGGEEGSYYVWTPAEIERVAGPDDGPVLAALLGVGPEGNFEGKSILTRRSDPIQVAKRFGRDLEQVNALFDMLRPALVAERDGRTQPGLDKKVVTSWNGLALTALVQGYRATGKTRFIEVGRQVADYLLRVHLRADGGLQRVSNGGVAEHEGVLDDYAFLSQGLLELYQVTSEDRYLEVALGLIEHAQKHFRHPRAAFYLSAAGEAAPLGRQVELVDGVRPSGNAIMLQSMLKAAAMTGDRALWDRAQADVNAYGPVLSRGGQDLAGWLDAALHLEGPFYDVVVAGDADGEDTRALLEAYRGLAPSQSVLVQLPAGGADAATLKRLPAVSGKKALSGKATAFVCQRNTCKRPTGDPAELRRQLLQGWKH